MLFDRLTKFRKRYRSWSLPSKYSFLGYWVGLMGIFISLFIYVIDVKPTDIDMKRYLLERNENNPIFFHLSLNKYIGHPDTIKEHFSYIQAYRPFQGIPEEQLYNAAYAQFLTIYSEVNSADRQKLIVVNDEFALRSQFFNCIERTKDVFVLLNEASDLSVFNLVQASPYAFPFCYDVNFPSTLQADFGLIEQIYTKMLRAFKDQSLMFILRDEKTGFKKLLVGQEGIQVMDSEFCFVVFSLANAAVIKPRFGIEWSRAEALAEKSCDFSIS